MVGIIPTTLQVKTEHDQKTEIIEYLKGNILAHDFRNPNFKSASVNLTVNLFHTTNVIILSKSEDDGTLIFNFSNFSTSIIQFIISCITPGVRYLLHILGQTFQHFFRIYIGNLKVHINVVIVFLSSYSFDRERFSFPLLTNALDCFLVVCLTW